jgi:hypothetical protein
MGSLTDLTNMIQKPGALPPLPGGKEAGKDEILE